MRRICFLLCLFLCAACSAHREAGTGDVAFRLVWDGASDLDLYVEDPAGTCIFFGRRSSKTGGLLDVDCNGSSDLLCQHPVENVFWPVGTAPAGRYLFWLEAHSLIPAEAPLSFELQVLRGTSVQWRHAGALPETTWVAGPFEIDFALGRSPAPVATSRPLPECTLEYLGKPMPGRSRPV